MILKEGGKLNCFLLFIHHLLDYYVPPKRDVNYMFMKHVLSKEKKVRYINYFLYPNLFILAI